MSTGTGVLRGRDVESYAEISLTGSVGRPLSIVESSARTIRFVGTLGASVTLLLPLSPTEDRGRTYNCENRTSGGFTISLLPVAGGEGVDIAPDGEVSCYYDGTDLLGQGGGATSLPVTVDGVSTLYPITILDPVIGDAITWSAEGFVNTPPGTATMAIGSAVASGTAGSVLFIGAGGLLAQDNANLFWDDAANKLTVASAAVSGMTAGSVLFAGTGGLISQDNANLFYADSTNRLGIGTTSPDGPLHVFSSSAAALATFEGTSIFSSVIMQLGANTQQAALRVYPGVDASVGEQLVEMGGIILRGHYWSGATSVGADGWWRIEMEDTSPTFYLVAGTGSPAVEKFWIRQDGQITLGLPIPFDNPGITDPVILAGGVFVSADVTFNALADLIFNEGTGSMIGTDPAQKMGFWGATPVVRSDSPTGTTDQKVDGVIAILETYGLLGV